MIMLPFQFTFRTYCLIIIIGLLSGCSLNNLQSLTIIEDVPDNRMPLYRTLLPEGATLPVKPQVKLQGSSFMVGRFYLETVLGIRVNYKGEEYWYSLRMPMNNKAGYEGGFVYGYPKNLTDICHREPGKNEVTAGNPYDYEYYVKPNLEKTDCDFSKPQAADLVMQFEQDRQWRTQVDWPLTAITGRGLSITPKGQYIQTEVPWTTKSEDTRYGYVDVVNNMMPDLLPSGRYPGVFQKIEFKWGSVSMVTKDAETKVPFDPKSQ